MVNFFEQGGGLKGAFRMAEILGGRVVVHGWKNYRSYGVKLFDGRVFDYSLKWWYATEAEWQKAEEEVERIADRELRARGLA